MVAASGRRESWHVEQALICRTDKSFRICILRIRTLIPRFCGNNFWVPFVFKILRGLWGGGSSGPMVV